MGGQATESLLRSSPPGSSTASPANSAPGSPTLAPSMPAPSSPSSSSSSSTATPVPIYHHHHHQPGYAASSTLPPGTTDTGSGGGGDGDGDTTHHHHHQHHHPPSSTVFRPNLYALPPPPPHARYAQISTPYDFLVSYSYFSEPQGFKPYHFRQCFMPTSGTYVIVEKAWSTQTDLDAYRQIILRFHPGCYADLRHKCVPSAPDSVRRPKVQVCPLFSSEMQFAIDRAIDPGMAVGDPKMFARLRYLAGVEEEVVFFAVVQGAGDGAASKLVVRGSFYQIMTEIFSAAANQYSVVFSGAMRERDLGRLGKGAKSVCGRKLGVRRRVKCEWEFVESKVKLRRVDNYDDLLVDDPDKNVVRVGC